MSSPGSHRPRRGPFGSVGEFRSGQGEVQPGTWLKRRAGESVGELATGRLPASLCEAAPNHARRRLGLFGLLGLAASAGIGLAGCGLLLPPTVTPMAVLRPAGACGTRAPVLLVMLPGAYSRPAEFVDEGFVTAVRSRGLAADILVADAHLGYFKDRSVLDRLRQDIVLPARAQGYAQIWLVGISIGGFAALGYGARHGDDVDGILALAPYPGQRQLLQEIAAVGGPAIWRTLPRPNNDEDLERDLWQWLSAPPGRLPVYLGNGRDDRFVDANRQMAGLLPAGHSDEVPGGHDWPAWRALWSNWLDRGLLPKGCTAALR